MIKKKLGVLFIITLTMLLLGSGNLAALSPVYANNTVHTDSFVLTLQKLLETESELQGSLAGISIRDREAGELLFENMADVRLAPASNMKLFTAAAALQILGEDYSFITEVYGDGKVEKGTLKGNLYIKGNGDTSLSPENLDKLAQNLKKDGISVIEGDIVADDSWYDQEPYSVDLAWSDTTTYYGAPVSALTLSPNKEYDAGTVLLHLRPSDEIGESIEIDSEPNTNELKIINNAITVKEENKNTIKVGKKYNSKEVIIEGELPINTKVVKEWVPIDDPTSYTLDIFRQSLEKQGIKVTGEAFKGTTPQLASLLTTHKSIPLSELLVPFMKLSNNTIAETLVKEMGVVRLGEGSFEKGLIALTDELETLSVPTSNMLIRDGSGVSPIDLVTANDITLLLYSIQKQGWFPTFMTSLPISGEEDRLVGGTLRNRLNSENTKGKVYAKTGTLSAVSSLSGYVESKNGKEYIFSILFNHLVDEEEGKIIEDKIIELLASY